MQGIRLPEQCAIGSRASCRRGLRKTVQGALILPAVERPETRLIAAFVVCRLALKNSLRRHCEGQLQVHIAHGVRDFRRNPRRYVFVQPPKLRESRIVKLELEILQLREHESQLRK